MRFAPAEGYRHSGCANRINVTHASADAPDLRRAIEEIEHSALRSYAFSDQRKREIALQLGFLATEARQPEPQRKAAIIKPVLNGLRLMLSTSAEMLSVWNTWGPTLMRFFQTQPGSLPGHRTLVQPSSN